MYLLWFTSVTFEKATGDCLLSQQYIVGRYIRLTKEHVKEQLC